MSSGTGCTSNRSIIPNVRIPRVLYLRFVHKWNLTSCVCQLDLSPSPPASLSNYWTSDSLSSQLVESSWKVTPLKSHAQAVRRTPPPGYWGVGSGHDHGQKKGQNRSLLNFFVHFIFFSENNVLGIIVQCSPQRGARFRLDSVAVAWVDSPQPFVDSAWGETCLLLLTVCSCLFILLFY